MNLLRARAGKVSAECPEDTLCGIPRARPINKDRNQAHKVGFAYIHYRTWALWLACGISRKISFSAPSSGQLAHSNESSIVLYQGRHKLSPLPTQHIRAKQNALICGIFSQRWEDWSVYYTITGRAPTPIFDFESQSNALWSTL